MGRIEETTNVLLRLTTGEEVTCKVHLTTDHGTREESGKTYSTRECSIRMIAPGWEADGAGEDHFEALMQLRLKLEPLGHVLLCYGASLNVFPSGMMRDMADGLTAYRLEKVDAHKRGEDLDERDVSVYIFDTGPDVVPATVKEQIDNYARWSGLDATPEDWWPGLA